MMLSWLKMGRRSSAKKSTPRRVPRRWELSNLERREVPAAFTPGNIAVYRVGDGVATLANTGSVVNIDEYTPTGTFVQTVATFPSSGAGTKLIASGTATSEGGMTLSADGKYLAFAGYNATIPTSGLAGSNGATVNRVVGTLDSAGNSVLSRFSDFASANNPRSAFTTDGTDLWMVGGAGGIRYAKADASVVQTSTQLSTTVTNLRGVASFDGQLYISTSSGSAIRIGSVGTGEPKTAGQTINNIPGGFTNGGPYGFYFTDLDGTPGVDTLYVADDGTTSPTNGAGFQKYSLVSGSWTFNNSVTLQGLRGLAGHVQNGTVTLVGTTDGGSGSKIWTLTDSAGFNQNINGTAVSIVTAAANTQFRGIAFAPSASTPAELTSLTTLTMTASTGPVNYTVVFNQAVTGLTASNFNLSTTGGVAGTVGTPTTSDNITWTVPVTGITGNGTLRLDLANSTGVSPTLYFIGFSQGTTVTINNAPPSAKLDVVAGQAIYTASNGKSNNLTISLSGANYTFSDSGETITLTPAAITAGWTGNGTNTVSDTNGGTTSLSVQLLDGADTLTINSLADPLTATGGGDVGDNAMFANSVTVPGAVSATGFDSIDQSSGVTLEVTTLDFGANSIGKTSQAIQTKATTVTALGGAGGVYLREADGASFTLSASGSGEVSVINDLGTLTIVGTSQWGAGPLTLSSADGVVVNGALGNGATTGTITILANTDGAGSEGYSQSTSGSLTTSGGSISITVNTGSGGNGDAVMGVTSGANATIDVNAGSILWTNFSIPALESSNSNFISVGSLSLTTSGINSAIGTSASPLQTAMSSVIATAGSGGVYITDWAGNDANVTASAKGAGNLQLWAGNASNNGFVILSAIAENGNISIRTDDGVTLNGPVGGASFTGTVLIEADRDGQNNQTFQQMTGSSILTSNTSNAAVTINVYSVDGTTRLGNITTGNGGRLTVNAAALLGNGSDVNRTGKITQLTGTFVDVGTTGSVVLSAKDDSIGEPGGSTQVLAVTAGSVSATTNSSATKAGSIFINASSAISFQGSTTSNTGNDGVINVTSTGVLTLNGNVKNDAGGMTLSGTSINQTAGTLETTGTVNLTGTQATFTTLNNKATSLIVPSGMTVYVNGSFDPTGAVQVDGVLAGSGSVGTATVMGTGKVEPGNSPGRLTTGNVVFNTGSTFNVELNGGVAGTSYDQLTVNGTVDLGGATLTGSLGFTPTSGQIFRIVDNDSNDPIVGTFNGYSEGATVVIGATNFTISYVGGDGNDVTLKAPGVVAPPPTVVGTPVISDGSGSPVTHRSMVRQIVVTFSEAVNFSGPVASAFTVHRTGNSATNGNPIGDVSLIATPASGPASIVTITFNTSDTTFVESFGSLIDGIYNFTIDASKISGTGGGGNLDGDGIGGAGGDYTVTGSIANKYFRLYGDHNGDGTVNQVDFNAFRLAFLAGPSGEFDFDNDGQVSQPDFNAFRLRFLGTP